MLDHTAYVWGREDGGASKDGVVDGGDEEIVASATNIMIESFVAPTDQRGDATRMPAILPSEDSNSPKISSYPSPSSCIEPPATPNPLWSVHTS